MTPAPGYLLPPGDAYTDELACTLVFYPNKPEYRRALLGSIVYLSNWLAWERDEDKRGKDAARAWKNAVDETLECWTMACFEELIADVARMRLLMETMKDCCDDNVTYYPTEEPSTEIIPYIGDPPEYYGETAITDWDDWAEHVCYNAHKYVDYLKSTSGQLYEAVELSSIFLGLIAAALTLLAFTGIGLPIAYGLAAAVVAGIALSATATTFLNTEGDFESARTDIVCAIINGYPTLAEAVETALGSGTDWDLFYQFIDYDAAMAIIYEGGYGTEYLPSETRDDCGVCDADAQFVFDWAIDIDGFTTGLIITAWDAGEFITTTPSTHSQWKTHNWWTWNALETRFGFTMPVYWDQIRFKFYVHPGEGYIRHLFKWGVRDFVGGWRESPEIDSDDYAQGEWHQIIVNFPATYQSGAEVKSIRLRMYAYSHVTDQRIWFDDFGVFKR